MSKKKKNKLKPSRQLEEFLALNEGWRPYCDLLVLPPSADELAEEFPDVDAEMLQSCMQIFESRGMIQTAGAMYLRLRRQGEPDSWAAMVALKSPPSIMTDSVYFAGHPGRVDDLGIVERTALIQAAKRKGFTPGPGDVYSPSLAQSFGDPLAWIPPSGGRAHVRKVCEMRGLAMEGAVTVKGREPERDPYETAPAMAEDLIVSNAMNMIEANPALKRKKPQEIRQMVLDAHGPTQ